MTIQPVVRSMLLADGGVRAIAGSRVYDIGFIKMPEFPAIQLQRISETLDSTTMVRNTTLQADCYAADHETAAKLSEVVQAALTNRACVDTKGTILSITPVNTTDFYAPENRTHRISTDYSVVWRPTL